MPRRPLSRILAALMASSLLAGSAGAATITASSRLELIFAIAIANSDAGFDTIIIESPTILLDQEYLDWGVGLPPITTTMKIKPEGDLATIERDSDASLFPLLEVSSTGYLTLERMRLVGGAASGGAGAVTNDGILVLDRCVVEQNYGRTGAIQNNDSLTLQDCLVRDNEGWSDGGAMRNDGDAVIQRTTFQGNHADRGGGAIVNVGYLRIDNSTLVENSAGVDGGAIVNTSVLGADVAGTLHLRNVTIAFNVCDDDSSGFGNGGGLLNGSSATCYLRNTLIAQNADLTFGEKIHDCKGTLWSQGYNLIGNGSGFTLAGDKWTNVCNVDPKLAALADNGGLTPTCALLPGSPAIDRGNAAFPGGPDPYSCQEEDQRGYARPADGDGDGVARCDIGAFERNASFFLPPGGGKVIAPTPEGGGTGSLKPPGGLKAS